MASDLVDDCAGSRPGCRTCAVPEVAQLIREVLEEARSRQPPVPVPTRKLLAALRRVSPDHDWSRSKLFNHLRGCVPDLWAKMPNSKMSYERS